MGIKDVLRSIFKGRVGGTSDGKTTDTQDSRRPDISWSDLMADLDKGAQELGQYELDSDHIERYAQMFNAMKKELSGVPDAGSRAIAELRGALDGIIVKTFPQAFRFGGDKQVEDIKKAIFAAIQSLVKAERDQQIATLDLQIQIVNGDITECDYWIEVQNQEMARKGKALGEDPNDITIREEIRHLDNLVRSLEERIGEAKSKLAELQAQKRNIEVDAYGNAFRDTQKRIEEFLTNLPSVAELLVTIETTQNIRDKNIARLRSANNMIADALRVSYAKTTETREPVQTESVEDEVASLGKDYFLEASSQNSSVSNKEV